MAWNGTLPTIEFFHALLSYFKQKTLFDLLFGLNCDGQVTVR